jgi:hypothetical protein
MTRKIRNVNQKDEKILVSSKALNRLMTIAEIMEDFEFRCIATKDKGIPGGLITGFYISDNQKVGYADARIEAIDDSIGSVNIREQNKVAIGIAHGHGEFGVFHSPTDHGNFDKILSAYRGNDQQKEYLDFSFDSSPTSSSNGILKSYNSIDLELLLNNNINYEEIKSIQEHVKARILKRAINTVSSIVVNGTAEEIYGIKRVQVYNFVRLPEDNPSNKGDHPNYFISKGFEDSFSLDAIIQPFETDDDGEIKKDLLVNELKEKLIFRGTERPSSFRPKVFVPEGLPVDEKINKFSLFFVNYAGMEKKYSAWSRSLLYNLIQNGGSFTEVIEPLDNKVLDSEGWDSNKYGDVLPRALTENNNHEPTMSLVDKVCSSNKLRVKYNFERNIKKYVTLVLEEREKREKNNKGITPNKEEKEIPLTDLKDGSTQIKKVEHNSRSGRRSTKKRSKKGLEKILADREELKDEEPEKNIEYSQLPQHQDISKIICCDPIRNFDKIYQAYAKQSEDGEYKKRVSTNNRIEIFYQEFVDKYTPDISLCNRINELYEKNKLILQEEREDFLNDNNEKWKNIKEISIKTKEEYLTYTKELRFVRDNYFALGMEKEGLDVFNKLVSLKQEYSEQVDT